MRPASGRRRRRGRVLLARSVGETERAGAALGRTLVAGDTVCLLGPLGAGKTTFVRGALRALGVRGAAFSPTFTFAHEARGRLPVAHLDFYRLEGLAERRGLAEYLDGRHVTFVEWADRDPTFWPRNARTVRIARLAGTRRRIRISG